MSFSSKLTLYDFLCMFITGVLFLLIVTPEEAYKSVSCCKCRQSEFAFLTPFIYSTCAYIIGLIWHKFIEWLIGSKTYGNFSQYLCNIIHAFCRCNISIIQSSKEKISREFSNISSSNKSHKEIKKEYFRARVLS